MRSILVSNGLRHAHCVHALELRVLPVDMALEGVLRLKDPLASGARELVRPALMPVFVMPLDVAAVGDHGAANQADMAVLPLGDTVLAVLLVVQRGQDAGGGGGMVPQVVASEGACRGSGR